MARRLLKVKLPASMGTAMNVWKPTNAQAAFEGDALVAAIASFREPAHVVRDARTGRIGVGRAGEVTLVTSFGS